MGRQVSAINIKRLWYGNCISNPPCYYKVKEAKGDYTANEVLKSGTAYATLSEIKALTDYESYLKDNIVKVIDKNAISAMLASKTGDVANFTEIMNVHQDTWAIEESEPSQESYRNQLTGMVYRRGTKTMGEVTFNFTIGRYDFDLKSALMGGSSTATYWERGKGAVSVQKTMIALTEDDVYCILSYADLSTREANTDGAIGLAVVATAMEPESAELSSEYWVDGL